MNILVLGTSGLIGSGLFRSLSEFSQLNVFGLSRSHCYKFFDDQLHSHIYSGFEINDFKSLNLATNFFKPQVIINCIGITKHIKEASNPSISIPINSLWPHQLEEFCENTKIRLIHISTDCVFSGSKGNYTEYDYPDAKDLYGKTKVLGELSGASSLTIRTSTIGHELRGHNGLLDWFLAQENSCFGYSRAVFSGLPTIYLGKILGEYVLPNDSLKGTYHISSHPIDKFTLLKLIAKEYKKSIKIVEDDSVIIDRSLDCGRFSNEVGFKAISWPNMIKMMHIYG
ncbi:SDR family oxidoreductase [Polynucleobacter paneuropaeus]|nr:SDR family oxidoreductase [Polynucleobacter paneuropaeus]